MVSQMAKKQKTTFADSEEDYAAFKARLPDAKNGELVKEISKGFEALIANGFMEKPLGLIQRLAADFETSPEAIETTYEAAKASAKKKNNIARGPSNVPVDTIVHYGQDLSKGKYSMGPDGVWVGYGERAVQVATRAIWVSAMGADPVTQLDHITVSYTDSRGNLRHKELLRSALTDRAALLALEDAPIDLGNVVQLSAWLVASCASLLDEHKNYVKMTRPGWTAIATGHAYLAMPNPNGLLQAWLSALMLLVSMGTAGYTALVAVALAVIAPLVEFIGKRNTVLASCVETSKGKGTMFNFAISVFCQPRLLSLGASDMSPKGLQDRARENSGLPIFIDEFQTLLDVSLMKAEQVLYFIGNGQTRVTSSKAQVSKGGHPYFGVGFVASEVPILNGLHGGAQVRVVSLEDAPLQTHAQATVLQAAARDHHGTFAAAIAPHLDFYRPGIGERIEERANLWLTYYPALVGDDPFTVAQVELGLMIIAAATGVDLKVAEITAWFATRCCIQRTESVDQATAAFDAMVELLGSVGWGDVVDPPADRSIVLGGQTLGWRRPDGGMDVNPAHPEFKKALSSLGSERHAATWARRGWITVPKEGFKMRRTDCPSRVYRVNSWAMNRDIQQPT